MLGPYLITNPTPEDLHHWISEQEKYAQAALAAKDQRGDDAAKMIQHIEVLRAKIASLQDGASASDAAILALTGELAWCREKAESLISHDAMPSAQRLMESYRQHNENPDHHVRSELLDQLASTIRSELLAAGAGVGSKAVFEEMKHRNLVGSVTRVEGDQCNTLLTFYSKPRGDHDSRLLEIMPDCDDPLAGRLPETYS